MHNSGHVDIIIIGAGLVGASLAALLTHRATNAGEKSLQIALIDSGEAVALPPLNEPVFDPRVVALTHSSQALFEELGIWQAITAQRACEYTHMRVWDDDGTAKLHFSAQDIQQTHLGTIVENSIALSAVFEYLSAQPTVILHRNTSVEKIEPADDGSNVIHCTGGLQLQAVLVVAADGGQSTVRDLVGLDTREWDYQQKAIVATVESERSHQFTAWQNFLTTGPLAFLPLQHPSERYCSIVWSVDTTKADQLMQLDEQAFKQQLAYAFDYRLGHITAVSHRFCFPLRQRHATHYYKNNIVFVGDAAHTIHPLAGQGVNLGLLDVSALAHETLHALQRGLPLNDESLLRRYQRKRKSHNLEMMLLMEGLKRLFGAQTLGLRWLRNAGMRWVNDCQPLKNWLAKQAIKGGGK